MTRRRRNQNTQSGQRRGGGRGIEAKQAFRRTPLEAKGAREKRASDGEGGLTDAIEEESGGRDRSKAQHKAASRLSDLEKKKKAMGERGLLNQLPIYRWVESDKGVNCFVFACLDRNSSFSFCHIAFSPTPKTQRHFSAVLSLFQQAAEEKEGGNHLIAILLQSRRLVSGGREKGERERRMGREEEGRG